MGRFGLHDFFTAEGMAEFNRGFPRFLEQGHIGPLKLDLLARDGVMRRISVEATALRDEPGVFLMSR